MVLTWAETRCLSRIGNLYFLALALALSDFMTRKRPNPKPLTIITAYYIPCAHCISNYPTRHVRIQLKPTLQYGRSMSPILTVVYTYQYKRIGTPFFPLEANTLVRALMITTHIHAYLAADYSSFHAHAQTLAQT